MPDTEGRQETGLPKPPEPGREAPPPPVRTRRAGWWRRLVPTAGTMVALALLAVAFTFRILDPGWVEGARVRAFDLYQRLAPRAGITAVHA